jgi:hypothetical protein
VKFAAKTHKNASNSTLSLIPKTSIIIQNEHNHIKQQKKERRE